MYKRQKKERLEYRNLTFSGDTVNLAIGDSKEGWAQAIEMCIRDRGTLAD